MTWPASTLIAAEVVGERRKQDQKWGEQNHPDGTGLLSHTEADNARLRCEYAFGVGGGSWRHVLEEEFHEAMAESDPEKLRTELVQVAAVACAWIEAIDRRKKLDAANVQ